MSKITTVAAAGAFLIGSSFTAQAEEGIGASKVAENTYYAEMECRSTIQDNTKNTELCVASIEKAIRSLAAYQLDVSQNPSKYGFIFVGVGEIGNEIKVKPEDMNKGGHAALIDSVYEDIRDNLSLADMTLPDALVNADHALKKIFVYAAQNSYGVHPEALNIGAVVEQVWQSAQTMEISQP